MKAVERASRQCDGATSTDPSASTTSTEREKEGLMNDNSQGGGNGILLAAVVGAAIGAGVALLFAPCSGKETRDWLAQRGQEMKDKTTSAFAQGKESVIRAAKEISRDGDPSVTLRG
jgi:hypothetical protein